MVELLITIFVLLIGLLAVYSLSVYIISQTNASISRLTAAYLAQEGIEVVRNIRDTNWIQRVSVWNGLNDGSYEVDYATGAADLVSCADPCDYDNNLRFLSISGGFYKYSGGEITKFKRRVSISAIGDTRKMIVTVYWKDKGEIKFISAQENLYNWYNP
jgi:hypothetical protein